MPIKPIIKVVKNIAIKNTFTNDKYELPFRLISDTEVTLNEAFGVWRMKKMAGREYMGTVRTTFVTDENGVITHIIEKVDTKRAAEQILNLK